MVRARHPQFARLRSFASRFRGARRTIDGRRRVHSRIGGRPILAHRVQGHPGGECRGATPLCPPEAWPVERCLKESVSKRGQRAVCPPHQPAGIAKRAVWCEGVLNAGTTKGTSVVSHGSSWKCLRRQGAEKTFRPLDPRLPWHVGFEQTESCRQGRGSSQRDKPSRPSLTDHHPANAPADGALSTRSAIGRRLGRSDSPQSLHRFADDPPDLRIAVLCQVGQVADLPLPDHPRGDPHRPAAQLGVIRERSDRI